MRRIVSSTEFNWQWKEFSCKKQAIKEKLEKRDAILEDVDH